MNQPQRRPNELEIDDAWQDGIAQRLIIPVLEQHAYKGKLIVVGLRSQIGSLLQRQAHVDMIAQLPDRREIAIELKIVRWPGAKQGRPGWTHYTDLFLETWSCTVKGHEAEGWMRTSKADFLLWCQCSLDEQALDCWPFPFKRLQIWHQRHQHELPNRRVPNIIAGRELWTRGDLAPIKRVCNDLRVTGFRIDQCGLVTDLWGAPILHFLRGAA